MINRLLIFAVLLTVAACGTPTPYQPAMPNGFGYAQQQLEENRYRVRFAGNSLTERSTVETYLLYRAAEITLQRGYDHFVLTDQDVDKSTEYHGTIHGGHGVFGGFGHHRGHHGFGTGVGIGFSTARPIDEYEAYATILLGRGPKPQIPMAYDAREVAQRLSGEILRPADMPPEPGFGIGF